MKKIIKIGLASVFATMLVSCDDKELPYDFVDLGANAVIKDKKISRFDQDEKLNIVIITAEGVKIDNVEIRKATKNGDNVVVNKIADGAISQDGKSATFDASALGPYDQFGDKGDELYGEFNISLFSKLSNGKTINNNHPIEVVEAISFEEKVDNMEYLRPYDEKNIKGKDSIQKRIIYKVFTAIKKVDELKIEWKKNMKGSYADTGMKLDLQEDTIDLKKIDYAKEYGLQIGDTLYYKFTAKKGSLEESKELKIAIIPQTTNVAGKYQFSDVENFYNLSTESTDEKDAELQYDGKEIKPVSKDNFKIYKLNLGEKEAKAYFDKADLFAIKKDIESGSPLASISDLVIDKVYIYKTTRKSKDYYGLIKIGDVTNTGTTKQKVSILYKEGFFKLK